jgi:hypothetical protein
LVASAQTERGQAHAGPPANDFILRADVANLLAANKENVPLLLKWTEAPPAPLIDPELNLFQTELADIFGHLKTKEAIPFLIRNISMHRWPMMVDVWQKGPPVVMEWMPAVAALIQIGPDAFKALINAPYGPSTSEDRLAAVFVVSRTASSVEEKERARQFLTGALAEANTLRIRAEEGLRFLEYPQQQVR